MPIPAPRTNEQRSVFIGRCMDDEVMRRESPDSKQRFAICNSQWEKR